MVIYSIYKATNKVNNKVYIGFDYNWPSRKQTHFYNHRSKSCPKWAFYGALKKYGWDNFIWEVIYQSKEKEHTLKTMENYFINEYRSYIGFSGCMGYNSTLGGEGTFGKFQSKKNKQKMSDVITERNKKSNWYNNGTENKFVSENPGDGWALGRINQKPTTNGCKWYNNGVEQVLTKNPPDGWIKGMLPKPVESGKKISLTKKGKTGKKIKTPDGIFTSIMDAGKFYNHSKTWINRMMKLHPESFYLL